jgi:hypothetical protein
MRNQTAAQQWHEPDLLLAALVASGLCLPLGGPGHSEAPGLGGGDLKTR